MAPRYPWVAMVIEVSMFEYARSLPIYEHLSELTEAIWSEDRALVQALPGAGKTTCLPLALRETLIAGEKPTKIYVVQPRRVAAKLAAHRCSEMIESSVGSVVGYVVRDDAKVRPSTEVIFMTAGTFVQKLAQPQTFSHALVILDEFHERSVEMDLILAWLKQHQTSLGLRFVVMSATLDRKLLEAYLGEVRSFDIPGRTFPVETSFVAPKPDEPRFHTLLKVCREVINSGEEGAGLVFLPGKGEIEEAERLLRPVLARVDWSCMTLHGQLPLDVQRKVVSQSTGRRVVLSTNIAETSLTLRDVTWVVDSGEVRRLRWDLDSGFESLLLESISRASAEQRAGRAGRVQPGHCYRLFSSAHWNQMSQFEPASILREDIMNGVARGLSLGLSSRDWLTPANPATLEFVHHWLDVHALREDETHLSGRGSEILAKPMSIREALFVHYAEQVHQKDGALSWVALWQEPAPRSLTLSDTSAASDCEAWLTAKPADFAKGQDKLWRAWNGRVRQRAKALGASALRAGEHEKLRWAAAMASPDRVGFLTIGKGNQRSVQLSSGRRLEVDPNVVVHREGWVVVLQARQQKRSRGLQGVVDMLAELEVDWLMDLPGEGLVEDIESQWDESLEKVRSFETLRYGACVLSRQTIEPKVTVESRQQVTKALERRGLHAYFGEGAIEEMSCRLEIALASDPEAFSSFNDVLKSDFEKRVVDSIAATLTDVKELKGTDILDWLVPEEAWQIRSHLDRLVPKHCTLPSGRRLKIKYDPARPPSVATYLQEFFGLTETPSLGKQPLTIELWAPNGRPIQVTADLTGFWERHYPELAKSLRRRYPKHYWPDDPKSAQAERFKRRVHE